MELFGAYDGADFLILYCILLATCVAVGIWLPAVLRPEGRRSEVTDMEHAAVLAGGVTRHAMAVSSDLMARGGLDIGEKGRLRVTDAGIDAGPAGRSILSERGDLRLSQLKLSTVFEGKAIESELQENGLLMRDDERTRLRLLSASPYVLLMMIGIYRYMAGNEAGEATGLLLVLLVITAGLAIWRFFTGNRRTKAGNEVLRDLENRASRLRRAPVAQEAGFAVALFGTAVLVGTPWEPVHAMRHDASGGGGYAGDDGGGDSGGGCGGGCGGCGG